MSGRGAIGQLLFVCLHMHTCSIGLCTVRLRVSQRTPALHSGRVHRRRCMSLPNPSHACRTPIARRNKLSSIRPCLQARGRPCGSLPGRVAHHSTGSHPDRLAAAGVRPLKALPAEPPGHSWARQGGGLPGRASAAWMGKSAGCRGVPVCIALVQHGPFTHAADWLSRSACVNGPHCTMPGMPLRYNLQRCLRNASCPRCPPFPHARRRARCCTLCAPCWRAWPAPPQPRP